MMRSKFEVAGSVPRALGIRAGLLAPRLAVGAPAFVPFWAAAVACVLGATIGCDKKSGSSPAPSSPAASVPAAPTDWSRVQAVDAVHSMEGICRLCRLLDARHKGAAQPVKLTFSGAGATDSAGATYTVTAAQWKGILEMIGKTPDKKAAGRALPAKSENYADGLGSVRRYAYFIERESDSVLIFTVAKPLDDNSNG
jgi:hypothetical protein